MSDAISLDFEAIGQHASAVAGIADDVAGAVSAVRSGGLGEGAFGLLCAFLVPPTTAMSAAATGMFGAKQAMLLRTAGQLRDTAEEWQSLEQSLSASLGEFRGALDDRA